MSDGRRRIACWLAGAVAASIAWGATPGPADRPWVDDFRKVWETIRDGFYDPRLGGVDWSKMKLRYKPQVEAATSLEQGAVVINRMLAELGASHTAYYTDQDTEYYLMMNLFPGTLPSDGDRIGYLDILVPDASVQTWREETKEKTGGPEGPPADADYVPPQRVVVHAGYVGIGVFTVTIDGETFVRAVVDWGPADAAGIKVGDRLISAGGEPWHPIRPFLRKQGKPVAVRVQRTPDRGSVMDVVVVPSFIAPLDFFLAGQVKSERVLERKGRRIAYVHVWCYAGDQFQRELSAAITRGELADADALVLDVRDGYGGGSVDNLALFGDRLPDTQMTRRDSTPMMTEGHWKKPVALLVNRWTRSGKELFAYGFKKYGYGPVIGERTAGAVLAAHAVRIGDRSILYMAVTDVRIDGERLEGRGVEPDIVVPSAIPYSEGRDPQLDRAAEELAKILDEKHVPKRPEPTNPTPPTP